MDNTQGYGGPKGNIIDLIKNILFGGQQKKQADTYNTVKEARQLQAMGQVNSAPVSNYTYQGLLNQPTNTPTPTSTPIPTNTPTPTPTVEPTPTLPPDKGALDYYLAINDAAKKNKVPQDILYNVLKHESMNFNPDVISGKISSPAGAQGIGQFMPTTAKGMGFDPLDPQVAINKAAEYLAAKKKQHGTWEKALAAYNAGSGAVEAANGVPNFPETINYVRNILQESKIK